MSQGNFILLGLQEVFKMSIAMGVTSVRRGGGGGEGGENLYLKEACDWSFQSPL